MNTGVLPDADTKEYQAILASHVQEPAKNNQVKESFAIKLMELLGLTSFVTASSTLLTLPLPEKKVGGAALLGVAAVAADLHHNIFGGKVVEASQQLFGGAASTMQTCGVVACSVLSAGGFARMVADGGFKNPKDPRWLGVIATAGPFMAGHLMMQKDVKAWVENHFGKTLELAHRADGEKKLSVPSAPFFKQLAFVIGGAHILAYGMIKGDTKSKFMGSAFMLGPSLSLGNVLWKGAQDEQDAKIHPRQRVHYLSVTSPQQEKKDAQKLAIPLESLVNDQGAFNYDHFATLASRSQNPNKNIKI